jgi:hypothetical protein
VACRYSVLHKYAMLRLMCLTITPRVVHQKDTSMNGVHRVVWALDERHACNHSARYHRHTQIQWKFASWRVSTDIVLYANTLGWQICPWICAFTVSDLMVCCVQILRILLQRVCKSDSQQKTGLTACHVLCRPHPCWRASLPSHLGVPSSTCGEY